MLLDKIKELCKQNDITVTQLERNLSFGNGTIHRWSKNQPSIDKVVKVAKYFSVSINYLLDMESYFSDEAKSFALTFDSLSEKQKNLIRCYMSIISKEAC